MLSPLELVTVTDTVAVFDATPVETKEMALGAEIVTPWLATSSGLLTVVPPAWME